MTPLFSHVRTRARAPRAQLAEFGVNAGDIKKAKDAGYFTVEALQMNHSKRLKDIKGLSEAKIDKVRARPCIPAAPFPARSSARSVR